MRQPMRLAVLKQRQNIFPVGFPVTMIGMQRLGEVGIIFVQHIADGIVFAAIIDHAPPASKPVLLAPGGRFASATKRGGSSGLVVTSWMGGASQSLIDGMQRRHRAGAAIPAAPIMPARLPSPRLCSQRRDQPDQRQRQRDQPPAPPTPVISFQAGGKVATPARTDSDRQRRR